MEMNLYKCSKCEIITHDAMCTNSRILDNGCLHKWDPYSPQAKEEENKPVIQFIFNKHPEIPSLTFDMVKEDQFFINDLGFLCQKCTCDNYMSIADKEGNPWCSYKPNVEGKEPILKILPNVMKIEF